LSLYFAHDHDRMIKLLDHESVTPVTA